MIPPIHKKFLLAAIVFGIIFTTVYSLVTTLTFAFNPPTQSGGFGTGAIGVNPANNLSVGTPTPLANTKFLIMASSTGDVNNFSLQVVTPASSPILVVRNDGKVGIATSTPTSTLTVQGDLTVTGIIYGIINGQLNGTVSAANVSADVFGRLCCGSTGNYAFPAYLGVGTTTTAGLPQTLTVYGTLGVVGTAGTISVSATGNNLNFSRPGANYITATNLSGTLSLGTGGNSNAVYITTDGRVGIGTLTPGTILDVATSFGGNAIQATVTGYGGLIVGFGGPSIQGVTTSGIAGNLYLNTSGGNVGIGAATSTEKLEVNGNIYVSGANGYIRFPHAYGDANDGKIGNSMFSPGLNIVGINNDNTARKIQIWGGITQNQNNLGNTFIGTTNFPGGIWTNTANVGIGTTAPTYRLHVKSGTAGGGLAIESSASGADTTIQFKNYLSGNEARITLKGTGGDLGFFSSSGAESITITNGGFVGISKIDPVSSLHVPDGRYAQFEDNNAGAPPAGDCDQNTERGRISLDTSNNRIYICMGASRGWDYTTLID